MPTQDRSKKQVIDVGDLTSVVTESVQRALVARGRPQFPGRIIIGIILEPQSLRAAPQEER